jgi:hypothetical protein
MFMKFRMLFVAAALLALCTGLSFGQGASVLWYELDTQLTMSCGGGGCIPDGILVQVRQDVDNNGATDNDPQPPVGSAAGEWNYNQFLMNGDAQGLGCGYFFADAAMTSVGLVPANPRYWLRVETPTAIWRSSVWTAVAGPQDADPPNWNCETVIGCVPSNLVGDMTAPGQHACLHFCAPNALEANYIVFCSPNSSGPIVNVQPGCDACGDPSCTGTGVAIVAIVNLGGGQWGVRIQATGEGCACFSFDGCLPPACTPDQFVNFRGERVNNEAVGYPAYSCAHLQGGLPTLVTVCSASGGPLNPANEPIVTALPGCDPALTNCDDPTCLPVPCFLGPWGYNPTTGCFEAILVTSAECGCCCLTFEGFLAANVSNFDAIALSNSVRLDFSTASETNVDRFEIARAVKGHTDFNTLARIEATNGSVSHSYSWTDNSAVNGTTYNYRLVVVNADGSSEEAAVTEATPSLNNAVITEYALAQNFPNPFNPSTQIVFDVVTENFTTLKVFNANGQEVATLFNGTAAAGRHVVNFDAGNLTSGLYFYSVKIGNEFTSTKKMMLVK